MPNRFFSGRIPENLDERAKQYCAETGESKTQVLINALSKYLDFPIEMPATTAVSIEMFNHLKERVVQLEKKLKITSVSSTDNSLDLKNDNYDFTPDNAVSQESEKSNIAKELISTPLINDNADNTDNILFTDLPSVTENLENTIPGTNIKVLSDGSIEPVSELEMANLSKENRNTLGYHRKMYPNAPRKVTINGKRYNATCLGKGKNKTGRSVVLWTATPIIGTDNVQDQELPLNPSILIEDSTTDNT